MKDSHLIAIRGPLSSFVDQAILVQDCPRVVCLTISHPTIRAGLTPQLVIGREFGPLPRLLARGAERCVPSKPSLVLVARTLLQSLCRQAVACRLPPLLPHSARREALALH